MSFDDDFIQIRSYKMKNFQKEDDKRYVEKLTLSLTEAFQLLNLKTYGLSFEEIGV